MIPANLSPVANHLWQSTLFVASAWLLSLTLRKHRAAVRYGLWMAASVKFLLPFSLLVSAGSQLASRITPAVVPLSIAHVVEQVSGPFAPAEGVPAAAATDLPPVLLFSVWLCGFAVSMAVWLRLWRRFRMMLQTAKPLSSDLPIAVMTSPTAWEPGVVGIYRPVLLLPEGILGRLTPEQFQSILAHELCHVRRRDNLTAAIHMVVESIFWFHPLVWWIRARLLEERERACDEEVVRLGHAPRVYAEGVLNVCKFYLQSPMTCASGVTGGNLTKRIEALVNCHGSRKLTASGKLLLAAAGGAAVAVPILVGLYRMPESRAHSKTAPLPLVTRAFSTFGKGARAGVADFVRAQATRPPDPPGSSTQRNPFEAIPEPPEPPPAKVSGPIIEAIEFRGARRMPQFVLRVLITSRAGGVYDPEALRRDADALYRTGRFSDIGWGAELGSAGVIVRFVLVERPLIESVDYRGDGAITIAEILERFKERKIALRAETLYQRDELPRAAVAVQELLAERGRQHTSVTPLVESDGTELTVKITFRAEEKR